MDFSNLFMRLLELSPFVATLFFFLFTVWNSMQKKDEALTTATKEHQASMLQMQRDSILATNNSADAQRQLATALTDFKDQVNDKLDNIQQRQSTRTGSVRRLPVTPISPTSPASA